MNWRKVIQLTLVHVGVALTAVPITGTLNRVLIADLQIPALLVGVLVSLQNLLSPLQIVMGAWSDRYPIWGRHRAPWMLIGGLMASFGSYFTAHAVEWLPGHGALGMVYTFLAFLLWGVGVNLAAVAYLSLVSELAPEGSGWRSRTISVMWTAMILSAIVFGIGISRLLSPFSQEALYSAFGVIWLVSMLLVVIGASGVEPKQVAGRDVKNAADNPLTAIRLLIANPSARRFFLYLMVALIGVRSQDVLLEPFGGEVMQLDVAMTTRLESIWGIGVFLTLISGLWLVRRYGTRSMANLGAWLSAAAFLAIIVSGFFQLQYTFLFSVMLLGLGGGLMTVSNLSFMLDMTIPEAAGLYIGAWGVANYAGQAVGNIGSGALHDLGMSLIGNPLASYVIVFSLNIVALLFALWYFRRIKVDDFRRDATLQLSQVMTVAMTDR